MSYPSSWVRSSLLLVALMFAWTAVGHAEDPKEEAKKAAKEKVIDVVAPQVGAVKKGVEAAKEIKDKLEQSRSKKNKVDLCRAAKDRHYYLERKTRLKDPTFRKKKVKKCRKKHRESKSWCKKKVNNDMTRYKKGFHNADQNFHSALRDMASYYAGSTDPESVFNVYNGRDCDKL